MRLAEQSRKILDGIAKITGGEVTVRGVIYRDVKPFKVPGNLTGQQFLPKGDLGTFLAAAESICFPFRPKHFKPYTNLDVFPEGELFNWHGRIYYVTHYSFADFGNDTQTVLFYTLMKASRVTV